MTDPAIAVQGLTKIFPVPFHPTRKVVAVKDLSLRIEPGEVYGLLGPNGSGKSTTLKIILGLVSPTRGRTEIFGRDSRLVESREAVGFLPENPYFYKFLTGAETLRLKSYLVMCRNTTRDFAEFAELVDSMETHTAALVLGSMDRYYCGDRSRKQWVATQLVRRLADPQPSDEHDTRMSGPEAEADWAKVRERCLSVAVAMLEEAR